MSEPQPTEEWRDVPGFPGYQASDLGRVRSCRRAGRGPRRLGATWHVLRHYVMPNGYHQVTLRRNGVAVKRYVHQLVLEAFVGPCPPGMEARHVRRRDKGDNRLANLCWGTPLENAADALRHGSRPLGSRVHCSKLTEETAGQILADVAAGGQVGDLAKKYGLRKENVSRLVNGHQWKHVGGPRRRHESEFPGHLTSRQAARILGVTRARVQQLVKAGVIAGVTCRRGLMLDPESVRRALSRAGQRRKR